MVPKTNIEVSAVTQQVTHSPVLEWNHPLAPYSYSFQAFEKSTSDPQIGIFLLCKFRYPFLIGLGHQNVDGYISDSCC